MVAKIRPDSSDTPVEKKTTKRSTGAGGGKSSNAPAPPMKASRRGSREEGHFTA